ncbi:hypothetical protein ACWFNE_20180 [Cellulomonas sp. NPDC055163]
MSWHDDDGRHELYIASVFADGMSGGTTSSEGVAADVDADGRRLAIEDWQWRPEEEITGWRVCCDCRPATGSRVDTTVLATWERVRPPSAEDPAAGRFLAEGRWAASSLSDREDVQDLAFALWDAHREPALAEKAIADAAAAARRAGQVLDEAVRTGRAAGLSWVDVGRAVGITRQSARERWGTDTRQSTSTSAP